MGPGEDGFGVCAKAATEVAETMQMKATMQNLLSMMRKSPGDWAESHP
jgi:hypothetical protein